MNKKSLLVLAATPMILTSCNGIMKADFEKFQEKVGEIELRQIESETIKGSYKDEKVKFVLTEANTVGELAVAVLVKKELIAAYSIAENKDYKYYVGMGFKVKTGEKTVEFDKHGNVTRYVAGDASFTVSYKYAK